MYNLAAHGSWDNVTFELEVDKLVLFFN
uniref:Uncharacterized protein n=1 Tax=Arundo donax TaxID=35708 RepID=A0A0A9A1G2_ARUDO